MSQSKKNFKIGDAVQWKWMGNVIKGEVQEVHHVPVSKMIKNKNIKRNGSKENPAYLVKSKAGNLALKLKTELDVVSKTPSSKLVPRMFR